MCGLEIRDTADWKSALRLPAYRFFPLERRLAVLYVDHPDRVLIIAVIHMKRRPGYWRKRL